MKKLITVVIAAMFFLISAAASLAATEAGKAKPPSPKKDAPAKVEALMPPVIKLDRVEIGSYWGYYFDAPNRRGAPLVLAFVFSIENPNKASVMLDDLKFTVAFEDFEVNTVMYYDDNHVPGLATDYLRFYVVQDAFIMNGLLLVTSGHRLLEMNVKSTELLEKWWKGVEDFNFPISVRNGTANFEGPGGKNILVYFEGVFPGK